jgi:hypothetical protein
MIAAASNYVSIAIHDPRSKSQRKDSVQETATTAHDFIKKIQRPNRSEVVEELRKVGFSEIQATEGLRNLEDNHKIFLIEESAVLKVILNRNISQYEREQSRLQESWIKAKQQEGCFF